MANLQWEVDAVIGVAEPAPDGEDQYWVRWVPTVFETLEECHANLAIHGGGAVLPGSTTVVWDPTRERRSFLVPPLGRAQAALDAFLNSVSH